jgi:hypothetical protein
MRIKLASIMVDDQVACSSTNFRLSLGAVARTGGSEGNGKQNYSLLFAIEQRLGRVKV